MREERGGGSDECVGARVYQRAAREPFSADVSIDGPPPELARQERIAALEVALRGLVARIDRAGGYASPEEQDALRRARVVLGGVGAAAQREAT